MNLWEARRQLKFFFFFGLEWRNFLATSETECDRNKPPPSYFQRGEKQRESPQRGDRHRCLSVWHLGSSWHTVQQSTLHLRTGLWTVCPASLPGVQTVAYFFFFIYLNPSSALQQVRICTGWLVAQLHSLCPELLKLHGAAMCRCLSGGKWLA